LVERICVFGHDKNIDVLKFILNNNYNSDVCKLLKARTPSGVNGVVDSVRHLLQNYDDHNRDFVFQLTNAIL
jgi:hypothetical protein